MGGANFYPYTLQHSLSDRVSQEGILCNKQNLIYCGQEIDEGHLLSEYGIEDSSEICGVRLRAVNADDILVLD